MKILGILGILTMVAALGCGISALGSSKRTLHEEVLQNNFDSSTEKNGWYEAEKENLNHTAESLREASQKDTARTHELFGSLTKAKQKRELKTKLLWWSTILLGVIGITLTVIGFRKSGKPQATQL